MNEIVDEALALKGLYASKASILAVGNPSLIKNMRLGQKTSFDNVEKLFRILGIDFYYGLPNKDIEKMVVEVPLWGKIAAGGNDSPTDGSVTIAEDTALDNTTAPAHLTPQDLHRYGGMLALTVQGASMQPAYHDGDTIYIYI